MDRRHNEIGTRSIKPHPGLQADQGGRMTQPGCVLDAAQRDSIDASMREVAVHRGWTILALNVRTNHVHVVVSGDAAPERMMTDFKRWSTRRLRETGLAEADGNVWARHGSTRYLWEPKYVELACEYVLNRQ